MQDFFLDYCLIKELSHKKSRHTYLAHARQDTQQKFIIKIFNAEYANSDQKKGLLLADMLLSFKHPHIIPFVDIAIEQGQPYIVREYCPHRSLRQHLKLLPSARMDWVDAVRIVIQIGQALCYAHEHRIIHGNLKLDNVFYHLDGNVQITDFSLASFVGIAQSDYQSDLSSIHYMAPEQFRETTHQQSDQYSLACLAYELIMGRPPFVATDFRSLWGKHATEYPAPLASSIAQIPQSIDLVILKALGKEPHSRYVDMATFLAALERGLSTQAAAMPSSLPGSSSANTADRFLLSNPRDDTIFLKLPITPVHMTRPLLRLARTLGPSATSSTLAPSPITDVANNETRTSILSTSQPFTPTRNESDYKTLWPSTQTWNELHTDIAITSTDQAVSLAGAEQQTIDTQDLSKNTNALQAVMAQTEILQSHKPTKTYVLWMSIVLVIVILTGILFSSVFGASILPLPLRASTTNTQQSIRIGTTKTAATSTVSSPLIIGAQKQAQATSTPKATKQAPLHSTVTFAPPVIMLAPTPTPAPASAPVLVPTPTPILAPTPTPTPVDGSVQINAGGSAVGAYSADMDYTDGSVWTTNDTIDTSGVNNAAPESVYQTCRYGYDFTYLIPHLTPRQSYTVLLHFSAMSWTKQGQNVFDVTINGDTALGYYDINADAGGTDIAVVKSFSEVARSDGTIFMQFDADEGYVMVSGIQVLAN